jgi:hypothetical protein
MTDTTYTYCKIFVKNIDQDATKDRITSLFGQQFHRHSMALDGLTLEVRPNPDSDPGTAGGDDFVYWPTLIELDTDPDTQPGAEPDAEPGAVQVNAAQQMVETATALIRTFWEDGYPAVAAADFEDQLPWNGGIQRIAT